MIVIMVAIGGITRLTESGLSMVNWDPIMGAVPPRTAEEWDERFKAYQETPQFEKFNAEEPMTMEHFQEIFFWEYVHRMFGRLIGMAYALPFFYFLIRGKLPWKWSIKLGIGLILGGFQGLLGWYMVKSGLVDMPYVSHFRLAAHLSTALLLFCYLLWMVLELLPYHTHRKTNYDSLKPLRRLTMIFSALLFVQILYGAFTAGLRAGFMHNTYPLMSGDFFPSQGTWNGWLNNPHNIQFVHRTLGLLLLGFLGWIWFSAIRIRLMPRQKFSYNLLLTVGFIQVILGIYTIISGVQLHVAVAHQVCACFFVGACVACLHETRDPKIVTSLRS